jgi:hypothetical protein
MIYTSADVRKVGKDGWIRETVDLSPFTSRTAGERSSPLYLDEVERKYFRWFASDYRQNLRSRRSSLADDQDRTAVIRARPRALGCLSKL